MKIRVMSLLNESLKNCKNIGIKHLKTFMMFLLVFFLISGRVEAINVTGYIITNQNDTIQGFFKVSYLGKMAEYNPVQAANVELYKAAVAFRKTEQEKFKFYTPDSLKGFQFSYQARDYIYRRFALKYKNMAVGEVAVNQFLCLLYSDKYYQLYRNLQIDFNNGLVSIPDNRLKYMVYYLYNPQKGIVKAEQSKQYKTVAEFLLDQNFEPDFVSSLSSELNFVNIVYVLKQYKIWKNNQ